MLTDIKRRVVSRVRRFRSSLPDAFLKNVNGVIHVGANVGQERDQYARHKLKVLWIEPIPDVFKKLVNNIAEFPKQKAAQYLLTDHDEKSYDFKIANNEGASSSVLELALHKDIWPDVNFVDTLVLKSTTFDKMIACESVRMGDYQALVMDTQGSELLVLKGATQSIPELQYIKIEAPDFESYAGCCLVDDLIDFLEPFGFREMNRTKFAEHPNGGSYYDVVFKRKRRLI